MHSAIVAYIGMLHGLNHRALASAPSTCKSGTGCTRLIARRPGAQAVSVEQLTSFPLLGEPKPACLSRAYPSEAAASKKNIV